MERTPTTDGEFAYRIFLQIRDEQDPLAARCLRDEFVMQPVVRQKLTAGCRAVLAHNSRPHDWYSDVMQEATLVLLGRLAAGRLSYRDDGPEHFGGWLHKLCHDACADAWERVNRRRPFRIVFVDVDRLASVAARPRRQHACDRLMRAIGAIADGRVRAAMLHWYGRLSTEDSALLLSVSARTVRRLRRQGRQELRALLSGELADEE
jgi:DNA-directed RNA polymerase specialized sigma24 family protein